MKPRVIWTLLILLLVSLVHAQEEDTSLVANRGFDWLIAHSSNGNFGNDVETTAFATLALKESGVLDYAQFSIEYIRSQEDPKHCFPRGNCDVKSTAFALWALNEYGDDTDDIEAWLHDALTPALKDNWWLEVVTTNSGTCKISYAKGDNNDTTEKDVKVEAGTFPECNGNFPNTFFDLNSCLEPNLLDRNPALEFDINCNSLGPSTIISVIYNSGSSYFLIKEASTSRDIVTIENGCFGRKAGGACSMDTTLFTNWILYQTGSDVSTLLWLKNNFDEFKAVDNALLYLSTNENIKEQYLENLKSLQRNDGSFNKQVFETAIAILALDAASSSEAQSARDWLVSKQAADGSWDNNVLRTAAVLYSSFSGVGINLPPIGLPPVEPVIGPDCGDGICALGEEGVCPQDCVADICLINGECEAHLGENGDNCPVDCTCGDGICDSAESSFSCERDCGTLQEPQAFCGDGVMEGLEECDIDPITGFGDDSFCSGLCQADCTCGQEKGFPSWIFIVVGGLLVVLLLLYFKSRKGKKPEKKKPTFKPFTSQLKIKPSMPPYRPPPSRSLKSKVDDELDKSLEEAKKLLKKL